MTDFAKGLEFYLDGEPSLLGLSLRLAKRRVAVQPTLQGGHKSRPRDAGVVRDAANNASCRQPGSGDLRAFHPRGRERVRTLRRVRRVFFGVLTRPGRTRAVNVLRSTATWRQRLLA
jgi:hypothetical protein